jgi:sn-glycerol 3-phosphate transport system permease protein
MVAPATAADITPDEEVHGPEVGRGRELSLAAILLIPSLLVFGAFVFYPLGRTFWLGFHSEDPFGGNRFWVGWDQYWDVLTSDSFRNSLKVTFMYAILTVPTSLFIGLALAVLAHQQLKGMRVYRTIFASTVATSIAVVSMLWLVLLHPSLGILNNLLEILGQDPVDLLNDPDTALFAVSGTTVWQNMGLVFIVMIAGLQAIPDELYESATIDGHSPWSQFWRVTVPMLSPTIFFATVILLITSFQQFGQIDLLTEGGPLERTNVLMYSIFDTLFEKRIPGEAAAQAIVLFLIILVLTIVQFGFLEKRVHYSD